MQMSALGGKAEQLGCIEGYLACHVSLNDNRGGAFSKEPSEYVALISHWYRFDRATGQVDAKRQVTPIANVLFKFLDTARSAD